MLFCVIFQFKKADRNSYYRRKFFVTSTNREEAYNKVLSGIKKIDIDVPEGFVFDKIKVRRAFEYVTAA